MNTPRTEQSFGTPLPLSLQIQGLLLLKLSVVSVIGLINVLVVKRNMFAVKMNHYCMIRNGSKE